MNEQITKQDGIEHKPRTDTNNYVYVGSLSVFGLAISGYLLYSKFKKPGQNLIDIPTPPASKINTEPERNNKKRSHTQLDSRKQVIAFQDRVMTINIKEAQHPLK